MKKAVILGKWKAGLVEAADPEPIEDWAVVKIHAAPMCTEYKRFESGEKTEFLGHEAAGEVAAVAQPGPLKVGDRVVAMPLVGCGECSLCAGGDYIHCENTENLQSYYRGGEGSATFAQFLLKPAWLLPKIPDGVSYELAALACCGLGPSFGAMQRMQVNAFDTILITGAGPVGLGAVINARFRGARVVVVESIPYRVDRARELGAVEVLEPHDEGILQHLRNLTGGRGVDCALDCSGNVKAQRLCIDATHRRGRVGFIGECYEDLALSISPDMIRKGLTLIGSWHYKLDDYSRVMQVIQESPLVDRLISHVLPMSRIQEAFELSASHQTAKVMLNPWK